MSFEDLFQGNNERYLTFDPKVVEQADAKTKPTDYRTVPRKDEKKGIDRSQEEWSQIVGGAIASHQSGHQSFGRAPQRGGKCKFEALDIDLYPFLTTDDEIEAFLKEWRDPCLLARTKSSGIHVYTFFDDWIDEEKARQYVETQRDGVLSGDALANAKEIFPKPHKEGSAPPQINLPQCGEGADDRNRPVLAWNGNAGWRKRCNAKTKSGDWVGIDWDEVSNKCLIATATVFERLLERLAPAPKVEKKSKKAAKWDGSFKRPTEGKAMEGRNSWLYHCGTSMRGRGGTDDEIEEAIWTLVEEFDDPDNQWFKPDDPMRKNEVGKIISQVTALDQVEPKTPYSAVERMNEEWALMDVDGKVEFLNLKTGTVSNKDSWTLLTAPYAQIANAWLVDPERRQYTAYVTEDPATYDGPGYNVFKGYPVQPAIGDVSLFVDYVENILCGGDKALAHWVTTYVADGVQRPWSDRPGTGLALRGPQGGGKSFLGFALEAVLGEDIVLEVADSDQITRSFNADMFAKTFVLGEESWFVGSKQQANLLKNLCTMRKWPYEQKYRASFRGKNVHRLIATTNEAQAVRIDFDDRRWTVIEVSKVCPFPSVSIEARKWWEPYYQCVRENPGAILRYLLEYEVDREMIGIPHHTKAKAEDKLSSDPLLMVLDYIAQTGVCPDDERGDGRISTATLARECYAAGASRHVSSRTFANEARKRYGAETAANCIHWMPEQMRQDPDGTMSVYALKRTDRAGLQLPPLDQFRAFLAEITGVIYPEGGQWGVFQAATPETVRKADPNACDADAVEKWVKDQGEVVKEDIPF
jgi:hypothetical protein